MLLQLGDIGDNVKYLQYGLHILCCSPNGFDGEFGEGTLTAVKKFQSKYGLVSDGIVGDYTWNTLKNEITTIQSQLNKKGFNVGTVDGIAGSTTYNAVISFQNKNGLTADGQVGPATWDILFDTVSGGNSYSRILKVTSPLMYGEDIRAVQSKLNSLGYVAGTADGYYGNMTRDAIIKFQTAKGLDSDGEVGPNTWNALFNTSTSGESGYNRILKLTSPLMYGEDIKSVQNKLNSLGYNAGTADGYYGNGTRTAVIKFQTDRGLDTDGDVGPTTWSALFNTSISGGNNYSRILKVTSPLMYGEDVRAVQNKLNSLGYNAGTADGYYGEGTRTAVINFQTARGLDIDGEVGPNTWNYIFNSSPINEIINAVNNIGLFEGANFEIEALNAKSPEMLLSFSPIIKLYGESSFTSKLGNSPNNFINIAYSKDTIATNLFNSLNTAGVEHSISKNMIKSSISKLVAARNINDVIKYYIALEKDGTLIITLEASITTKTYPTLKLASTLYQRVIITVTPNLLPQPSGIRPKAVLTTPIGMELSDIPAGAIVDSSKVFDLIGSIIFAGVVIGAVYLGYAELVAGYTLIQSILEKVIWIIRA